MGRGYPGWPKFDSPNSFVLFIWTVFPLRGKVLIKLHSYGTNIFPCTEISPINKLDLGTWENFSFHMTPKVTFHTISWKGEISLVNLSKYFLANQDNF